MFDFLEQEIATIKTKRFHVVDGLADASLKAIVNACEVPFPKSYKDFVLRFGNAKLYKQLGYYIVGVLAGPVETHAVVGDKFYRFGHYQSSHAFFKATLLRKNEEAPVFDGRGRPVADGFETWLTKRCRAARSTYSKQRWAEIVAGPAPFTPSERMVVEARRHFTFQVAGITPQGNVLFEVHNGSDRSLPFLSIGVRWKDGSLDGGIWLPVSHVLPGQTAIVEHDVYNKMAVPSAVEVFPLPDPEPEERDRYWEFK